MHQAGEISKTYNAALSEILLIGNLGMDFLYPHLYFLHQQYLYEKRKRMSQYPPPPN